MKSGNRIGNGGLIRLILGGLVCLLSLGGLTAGKTFAKGKKYGLFIGITEYHDEPLVGAANDAKNWQSAMINTFGFDRSDTKMLLDGDATRQNIIDSINTFADMAEAGDFFITTYAGHGSLFPDDYSEEIDEKSMTFVDLWFGDDHYVVPKNYYDSTIVPVDADESTSGKPWRNQILDDELYNLFSRFAAKGVKVVFVSDSCHSGTISKGGIGESAQIRFMSPNAIFGGKSFGDIKFAKPGLQKKVEGRVVNGSYLVMSAARDNEVSWGARINGKDQGLFTSTVLGLIKAVGRRASSLSYSQLMNLAAPRVLKRSERYSTRQNPRLDSTFGSAKALIFQP